MVSINRFAFGEWYHCYSRGVDKRTTFNNTPDYYRFIELLYICNSNVNIKRSDIGKKKHSDIFKIKRGDNIVDIVAYSLMPNHFHILLHEVVDGGISIFMSKLINSYTKYFNIKNNRVGNLFVKPFKSRHVDDDNYFNYIPQYIHLNPAELFESKWKEGVVNDIDSLKFHLKKYNHSSFPDYVGVERSEVSILNKELFLDLKENLPKIESVVDDAMEYYKGIT